MLYGLVSSFEVWVNIVNDVFGDDDFRVCY